ncbi:MAG: SLBB domain-containing protein [Bacteroidetes bacterium]|nr:SLBB domain-containing protein [Bacteroidota bacterium]MBP7398287.1 SLBB domain-containing protein [Chitinophagales bacterium]MBK7108716.1 SLBB domain-containing protein [Bacteroidota bacterium]MBK8488957.1 SLBB domain-containing protein [Bacteroidota bacterium]MBK8680805.1 SLBB domain-containing protein [Bacteroidota bacterium]
MKKFSSISLLLLILAFSNNIFGQANTGLINTDPYSTQGASGLSPSAINPSMVSESSLKAMGFNDSEITAILAAMGESSTATTATTFDQIGDTQAQNIAAATEQLSDTTTPAVNATQATTIDETPNVAAVIYGQGIFRNSTISLYERVPNSKPNNNYIMGPGDQIAVSVWGGVSSYNENFTVSDDGYINPFGVGRIYLQGLTYAATKQLLKQKFGTYINLNGANFDVSLTYSKTIKVNIVGEVVSPGSYNIASINTPFNALVAAGGPNDIGSIRNIYVKRNNQVVKTLDVYQFLTNPGYSDDTYLQDNDYIVVPPIGRVVEVAGEVNRAFKYELIEGENLEQLLKYAGGLKSTAYTNIVTVSRYINNENVIVDINYDSIKASGGDFVLFNGDKITFVKIPETVENVVTIIGAVKFPGTYELSEGLRISNLIEKAQGVKYEAYMNKAYLIRKDEQMNSVYIPFNLQDVMNNPSSAFNFELTKFDQVEIFTKDKFRQTFTVKVEGAVKTPGEFPYYESMKLKDLLYYAGGLNVDAANSKIEIARILNFNEAKNVNEPTRVVIETIDVDKSLEMIDGSENFELQPYDIVFVRTIPDFEFQKNVTLEGEVVYPGVYTMLSKTETVAEIIARAGGFTSYAYPEGATIKRGNGNLTMLFLDKAVKSPNSKFNYILKENDIISVPRLGELVSLSGAIDFPFEDTIKTEVYVPFDGSKSAKFYIKKYGRSFHDDARRSRTYVVQPNGLVKRTVNILWVIHFYPKVKVKGSEVVVPYKPKKIEKVEDVEKEPFDWNVFATTMSASVLTFATIFILVENTNR